MNKQHFVFLLFLIPVGIQAQTGLIALKSHNGTAATYHPVSTGNFGAPPLDWELRQIPLQKIPVIREVIKINDTTVLIKSVLESGQADSALIYNHSVFSNPNITVDSMRKMGFEEVEFRQFDKVEVQPETKGESKEKQKVRERKTKTKQEKKRNGLIWLWIIGTGTFLGGGMLLGRRSGKRIPHYA